jgi:hypothetical protein
MGEKGSHLPSRREIENSMGGKLDKFVGVWFF